MVTSSNGNIFQVTGPLWREFTGHRWIPLTKVSNAELWCFFDLCLNKRLSKHSWGWWFVTPSRRLWRHCNVIRNWREWVIVFLVSSPFPLQWRHIGRHDISNHSRSDYNDDVIKWKHFPSNWPFSLQWRHIGRHGIPNQRHSDYQSLYLRPFSTTSFKWRLCTRAYIYIYIYIYSWNNYSKFLPLVLCYSSIITIVRSIENWMKVILYRL